MIKKRGIAMFVILVYDISEKRVSKVLKTSRKYLYWVQNSVLEGEISDANFQLLRNELLKIINEAEDSLIFYKSRTQAYSERELIGLKKGGQELFL